MVFFSTEPFRDHLPLRSSVEMSPISNERVYPPKPHNTIGDVRDKSGKRNWLSRMLGNGSGSGNREASKYRPLSGEGDEEELRQLKVEDGDEDGDGDGDEGSEEFEVLDKRKVGSGSNSRS